MKAFFLKVQLISVALLLCAKLTAATVYPLVLNPQILPPYSNCLLDYAASKRFNVFVLNKDINHSSYSFVLSIKMKQGNTYLINEKVETEKFLAPSGVPTIVDITPLLNHVKDIKNNGFRFDEGAYEFVFQAFDGHNPNIAVSEPAYLMAYLSQSEPPMCIYPNDNDCVSPVAGGVINFSWIESLAAVPDPSRRFKLEIYEMPDNIFNGGSDYSTRQRKAQLNTLVKTQVPIFSVETTVPFYSFSNTAGGLQKNHTYLWRVQIFKDGSNPDGKYTTSGYYKNDGWSEPFTLRYRNCDPWSQVEEKQEKRSDEEAPDLKVEVSDVVTISWEKDSAKYCGYRVGYNVKGQDSIIDWTNQTFAANESSWVISKNITHGVDYVARIEGITNCSESDTMFTEPKKADFKLDYKANNDCMGSISALSNNDNIASLEKGDIINACGKTVRLTEVTRNDDGSFSGFGVVTLPALPDLAGIRVKFDKINVNTAKEMTTGHIVSTKGSNPLTFNVNGLVNKQNAGTKTALQETIAESKSVGSSSTSVINVDGNKVSISGSHVGSIVDNRELEGIDDNTKVGENGKVTFANVNGFPVIDEGQLPFGHSIQIDPYYEVSGQWIALEEGKSAKLVAQFTKGDSTVNRDNVSFYIQAEKDAVKIEDIKWDATNRCEFTIFAGENKKHLNIIAVDKSGDSYNVLGRAFIQSMKKDEFTLHLVPVRRDSSSINVDAISKQLNAIYNPLGKYFTVQVEHQFDEEKKLEFLNDGLDVSEASLLNLESEEMKKLTQAYIKENPEVDKSEKDAYIFICPSAQDPNVKGDMPRNKRMGYVFSNAKQFGLDTDPLTIAHELGHGLFDLEHTFDFGVARNTTTNLMDYKQGTDTKVWQWTVMDDHHEYTLPFLEDAEDSQWVSDGHYYLFTYLGLLLGLDYNTAEQYGKWAEEPDTQIDSNGIYWENTTWLKPYLQQQNHALTGGYHGVELAATLYALHKSKSDPYYVDPLTNDIFKGTPVKNMKFLFHRFGDCFAHSNINESDLSGGSKVDNVKIIKAVDDYVGNVYHKINSKSDTIILKDGKFYTSYTQEEFTRGIVNAIILSQDVAYMGKIEYWSNSTIKAVKMAIMSVADTKVNLISFGIAMLTSGSSSVLSQIDNDLCLNNTKGLEEIWTGMLKTLGSNKINKSRMYGGPANKCLAFTEGHTFFSSTDDICQRPKLFKYYTRSAIDLLCDYDGTAKKSEKGNAYKAIESVVDWAEDSYKKKKENNRLDGVLAFLIEYERAKANSTSDDVIEVKIPIKHLTQNANVFERVVNKVISFLKGETDIEKYLSKQADDQSKSLFRYLVYCKNNQKYLDLKLDNISEKNNLQKEGDYLSIKVYKK